MSTTTTTDELTTLLLVELFTLLLHLNGVLAFSTISFTLSSQKGRCHYSPRIEDEQPCMHAFRILSITSIPTSTFSFLVRRLCLLQSL
jgi:hypothetical protein